MCVVVICKFKITSFLCVCVLLLPFKLKFIFFKVKLMVYYLKIDRGDNRVDRSYYRQLTLSDRIAYSPRMI